MIEESSITKAPPPATIYSIKIECISSLLISFVYVTTERTFAGELKFAG